MEKSICGPKSDPFKSTTWSMSLDVAHQTPVYKYRLPVCIRALILTDWINFHHSKDTSSRTILICKIASLSVWLIHEKMKSWVDHVDEDVSTISECFFNKMIINSDINTMYDFSTPMKPTTFLPNSDRWNVGSIFVSFRIGCFVNLNVLNEDWLGEAKWTSPTVFCPSFSTESTCFFPKRQELQYLVLLLWWRSVNQLRGEGIVVRGSRRYQALRPIASHRLVGVLFNCICLPSHNRSFVPGQRIGSATHLAYLQEVSMMLWTQDKSLQWFRSGSSS